MVSEPAATEAGATWALPAEPRPVRLMNTMWADRRGVHDALRTAADLGAWLGATGLDDGGAAPSVADLAAAQELRSALRRLAAARTGDARRDAASPMQDIGTAVSVVNRTAGTLPAPSLLWTGTDLERPSIPTDAPAAFARLATEAVELLTHSTWPLRACLAPGCVLYFVRDHPRREWCSAACGNRARVARHFARHRQARDHDPTTPAIGQ